MAREYATYIFWIRSSRGTDDMTIRKVPKDTTKDVLKEILENWCSHFGAWHVSENCVSYGMKSIKVLPRRELLKKWNRVCKAKAKIDKEHKLLQLMFSVPTDTDVRRREKREANEQKIRQQERQKRHDYLQNLHESNLRLPRRTDRMGDLGHGAQ